ncbi:MAG TPA: hypothetical protein VF649_04735 [Sphingomonas sp.]|jgi:hypothetical protein|uniref:hypothetical protein n=1 Tax=Sphingomonas sp. TaxID=28214 RepID=UPI002ED8C02D
MSHTPPIPDAATAPFPAHPAPRPHADIPTPPTPPTPPKPDSTGDSTTRRVIAGAAVGIGSAAIVAALLYTNRKAADAQKIAAKDRAQHPEAAD